jgi:hypothetical protein
VAKFIRVLCLSFILVFFFYTPVFAGSDEEVKKEIIQDSIRSYSGNCPCPYNLDRAGRKCGKRSAYSKPGGYSPICYSSDVTEKMVENHKKR